MGAGIQRLSQPTLLRGAISRCWAFISATSTNGVPHHGAESGSLVSKLQKIPRSMRTRRANIQHAVVYAADLPRMSQALEFACAVVASSVKTMFIRRVLHLIRAICFIATMAYGGAAFAQIFSANTQATLDTLYQRILRDPTNVALTLQYAQMAKYYGDYEAAISAYERLLLFNPTLSEIKYELGVLYFLLESYPAARSYFEAVAASRNISTDSRNNTIAYLKEIDRRLSPSRFTAYFHTGLRHQSNANAGSAAGLVRFGGQDVTLDSAFAKKSDWNAYSLTALNFEHDLGDRGDTFEAGLAGYYARQFQIQRVNLGAAELQVGPRLLFLPEYISGTTTKFYGIVNGVFLGDQPYFRTYGAGMSLRSKLNPVTIVETSIEYRDRKFYDSADYPTAGEQTGELFTYSLVGSGMIFGPVRWFGRVSYDWNRSDFTFWSYRRPSVELGMPMTFNLTTFGASRQGVVSPYVGGSLTDFKIPNPAFDPIVTRRDVMWYVGTTAEANIVGQVSLRLNVHYLRNDSNIINFAYRNLSVSFGPAFRF